MELEKVQHVIVLMLENAPSTTCSASCRGLGADGTESSSLPGAKVHVSEDASRVLEVDPTHSHEAHDQLFTMSSLASRHATGVRQVLCRASMERQSDRSAADMGCFAPRMCRCWRNWPASRHLPEVVRIGSGRDRPNRNYAHAATSHGQVNIKIAPVRSYDLRAAGANRRSWRIYHDGPAQAWAFPKCGSSPGGIASRRWIGCQGHRKGRARPLILRRAGPWSAPLEPHVQRARPQQQHGSEPGRRGLLGAETDRRHLRCSPGAPDVFFKTLRDHLRRTRWVL